MEKSVWANGRTLTLLLLGVPAAVGAGIYFAMQCLRKKRSDSTQQALLAAHGGKQVLQRLIDYHSTRDNMNSAEEKIQRLLNDDKPDLKKLKNAVSRLSMTTREDKAAELLKTASESAEGKPHEAYELEMLYVERLIYKGKWNEAQKYKCLKDERITDARRPFIKAMISIMSGKPNEGKTYWEQFREIHENFYLVHIPKDEIANNLQINNFDEFKKIVELLQQETKNIKSQNSRSG